MFTFDPPEYAVEVDWGKGWLRIYAGDNIDRWTEVVSFWAPRSRRTRCFQWGMVPWREQLDLKFDALETYIRWGYNREPKRMPLPDSGWWDLIEEVVEPYREALNRVPDRDDE